MKSDFDVIVVGLGAMGSAALYHLARRGARVLGIDQYDPPHSMGSSHGETRVIREAYFEHPLYVPLVQRAYELWGQLERATAEPIYLKTGGLMLGEPASTVVAGALESAREHQLPFELLDSGAVRARYPGLQPEPAMVGVFEPRAGILFAENCLRAHLKLADQFGAQVQVGTPVLGWSAEAGGVTVRTAAGTLSAAKLVITAGPWVMDLVAQPAWPFSVERQVLVWLKTRHPSLFSPERFPIHLWEYDQGKMFYGFPDLGSGLKLALHHQGELTSAGTVDRSIREADLSALRALTRRFLPEADGEMTRATVCLYTNLPDGHFLVDFHPDFGDVVVASPCSGHGFKFSSALGEVLADMALTGGTRFDLSLFSARRFGVG